MFRPSAPSVVVAILGLLLAAMAVATASRARSEREQQRAAESRRAEQPKPATKTLAAPRPEAAAQPAAPEAAPLRPLGATATPAAPVARAGASVATVAEPPKPAPRPFAIASVKAGRTIALRARPGGAVVSRVQARTEFGSQQTLAVAARRGRWLGVTSTTQPNNKLAWIPANDAVRKASTKMSLHVDLSRRSLQLRRGSRVVRKATVAIGRPGASTPTGRFAVTDKLNGGRYGAYYGCCILALSGHQPNLPPGWPGGDRLAIHGTSNPAGIGKRVSAGCLHAAATDLRVLMKRVPLGTPVFIRR